MLQVEQTTLTSHGFPVDTHPDVFGSMRESNEILHDVTALRERMAQDGYLLLRGVLDRDVVLDARRELLEKLASIGEIDTAQPLMDAIISGTSIRGDIDIKAFMKDLRTGPAIRRLVHSGKMVEFYTRFLGDTVLPFDFIWLRPVPPGRATGCHIDWVYMGRGTRNLYTSWTPLGDVAIEDGALMILEGSHRRDEVLAPYRALDVDRELNPNYIGGWFGKDPMAVRQKVGGRWVTTNYAAGDLLLFTAFTMHCALDNRSPRNRLRLTSDTRYQLASEPADERWVGEDPTGHTTYGKSK